MKTIEDHRLASRALDYLRSLDQDIIGPLPEEPSYRLMLWSDYHQKPLAFPFSTDSLLQRARIYKALEE